MSRPTLLVAVAALQLLLRLPPRAATAPLPSAARPCNAYYDAALAVAHPYTDTFTANCSARSLLSLPKSLESGIRHLDASYNRLDRLRESDFEIAGLNDLFSVDLSHNQITTIEDRAFAEMRELRRVSLAYNRLRSLPEALFSDSDRLWSLSLAGNNLVIPANGPLLVASQLHLLDVSDCKLTAFPDGALGEDNALEELRADGNSIAEVHVTALRRLQRLTLDRNRVGALGPDAFAAAPDLIHLSLGSNPVVSAAPEDPIVVAESLRVLHLSGCTLHHATGAAFASLPALRELRIADCSLKSISDDTFSSLTHLRRVDLSGNRLHRVPSELFLNNAYLSAVDLSGNPLEPNPGPLLKSLTIEELNLRGCEITSVPPDYLSELPHLRNVSLAQNHLEEITVDVVDALPELGSLDLSGNPLVCQQKLREVWRRVQERGIKASATCVRPVPGDWDQLRYFDAKTTLAPPASSPASSAPIEAASSTEDPTTPGSEVQTAQFGVTETLIYIGIRWGPPVGTFLLVVVAVLTFRKVMNRMQRETYYQARPKDGYGSDSDEEDGGTMSTDTTSGSRVSPTSDAPPARVGPSPTAAKRLSESHPGGRRFSSPRPSLTPAVDRRTSSTASTPPPPFEPPPAVHPRRYSSADRPRRPSAEHIPRRMSSAGKIYVEERRARQALLVAPAGR